MTEQSNNTLVITGNRFGKDVSKMSYYLGSKIDKRSRS